MCIELGQLAQGYKDTKSTNTTKFLTHDEICHIPSNRNVTYARIVVDYHPQKKDPNRVRITVGGNLIITLTNCQPAQQISQLLNHVE